MAAITVALGLAMLLAQLRTASPLADAYRRFVKGHRLTEEDQERLLRHGGPEGAIFLMSYRATIERQSTQRAAGEASAFPYQQWQSALNQLLHAVRQIDQRIAKLDERISHLEGRPAPSLQAERAERVERRQDNLLTTYHELVRSGFQSQSLDRFKNEWRPVSTARAFSGDGTSEFLQLERGTPPDAAYLWLVHGEGSSWTVVLGPAAYRPTAREGRNMMLRSKTDIAFECMASQSGEVVVQDPATADLVAGEHELYEVKIKGVILA